MWRELAKPWQVCLETLWRAWCAKEFNSYCIAAVVVDATGCIVSTGVSHRLPLDRIRLMPEGPDGAHLREHVLAHAEMQALLSIDENRPTIRGRQCSLYTTLEPCPMCLGAVCMCNSIGHLHYASRDPWAGSACLLDASPFLRRKRDRMRVIGPEHDPHLERVVTGLTLAMELCGGRHKDAPEIQAAYGPLRTALTTADALLSDGRLVRWRQQAAPIANVLDAMEQIVGRWL
jgi:tRNA(Arg) A34 adenosine deaminase TadA